jgi:hypothetical protein
MYDRLSQFWVIATLLDHTGETIVEPLAGRVTDSAHPMPSTNQQPRNGNGSRDQAYFYFPDLAIPYPGRYRIRLTLMRMDYSYETLQNMAVVEDYVDSHSIIVEESAVNHSRPSKLY